MKINPVDNMRFRHEPDQLCFDKIVNIWPFWYFPGVGGWGGWGKIENKDHLSPAKDEIGAELDKKCMDRWNCLDLLVKKHIKLYLGLTDDATPVEHMGNVG